MSHALAPAPGEAIMPESVTTVDAGWTKNSSRTGAAGAGAA